MQAGLLKVVPQAVLDLLTWQELEKKVCGDPEVTVDALRKLSEYGGLAVWGRGPYGQGRLGPKLDFRPGPQPGLRTSSHLTLGCSTSGKR